MITSTHTIRRRPATAVALTTTESAGGLSGLTTQRIARRRRGRWISLRQSARGLAAWWADDSMGARFEQECASDQQMLRPHSGR